MPAVARIHESDPRQELLDKIGSVDDIEVFNNEVLCAIYIAPEKTKGGIILTQQLRDEDKYQGKVGLILKCGPQAFKGDGQWVWPEDIGVGDWVAYRVSDAWATTLNASEAIPCRIIKDEDIRMRLQHPDRVW